MVFVQLKREGPRGDRKISIVGLVKEAAITDYSRADVLLPSSEILDDMHVYVVKDQGEGEVLYMHCPKRRFNRPITDKELDQYRFSLYPKKDDEGHPSA